MVARDEAEGRGGQRLARGINPSIITTHKMHITAHTVLIVDNWSTNDTSSPYHNLRGIREPSTGTDRIAKLVTVGVYVDETIPTRRPNDNDSWVRLV